MADEQWPDDSGCSIAVRAHHYVSWLAEVRYGRARVWHEVNGDLMREEMERLGMTLTEEPTTIYWRVEYEV